MKISEKFAFVSCYKISMNIFIFLLISSCGGGSGGGGGSSAQLPLAPSNLIVNLTTNSKIDLVWSDNASNESGYKVEKSTDNVNYVAIAMLAMNSTSYSDLSVSPENSYYYRVRSYNDEGESLPSDYALTTTYTLTGVTSIISASVKDLNGNEIPASSSSGSGYTSHYVGFSLCMPADPYASPEVISTAPNNIYRCENTLTGTLTPGVASTIAIAFTIPKLFIDGSIDSALTGTVPVYIEYTDVVATFTAQLTTTADGRKKIANIIGPNTFTYTSKAFHSNNSALNSIASTMLSMYSQLETQILDATQAVLPASVPAYIP